MTANSIGCPPASTRAPTSARSHRRLVSTPTKSSPSSSTSCPRPLTSRQPRRSARPARRGRALARAGCAWPPPSADAALLSVIYALVLGATAAVCRRPVGEVLAFGMPATGAGADGAHGALLRRVRGYRGPDARCARSSGCRRSTCPAPSSCSAIVAARDARVRLRGLARDRDRIAPAPRPAMSRLPLPTDRDPRRRVARRRH